VTELSRGQELALATTDGGLPPLLRMGIGWDKKRAAGFIGSGAPDVDLDASALQFAGDQLFDLAFFNHPQTRDGSTTHLGDNLSGHGAEDDESITVDLARVHGPVDTLFFVVTSFHGHSLEYVDRAYCHLLDDATGTEVASMELTLNVTETGVVMAKLVRDGASWRLVALGEGIDATEPAKAVTPLRRFL
jgi:tellurium resistance protein TerZ